MLRIRRVELLQFKKSPREVIMLYKLGRFLQIAGMIILPVGMVGNVYDEHRIHVGDSLAIAALGVAVFVIGWLLQQAGRSR